MQTVGNLALPALVLAIALSLGCRRDLQAPGRPAQQPVRTGPTWGPETEGLQIRLRPTKRIWGPGETITFKLDIRNRGKRLFAFDASEPIGADRVAMDGRWYRRRRLRKAASVRPLGPGAELTNLVLALPPTIGRPRASGRHSLRVALLFEGVEVASNPVAIEITPAP